MTTSETGPAGRRLAAIFYADVVGFSRLMGRDEDATLRALGERQADLRGAVEGAGGRIVDFTGDCCLAEFASATNALNAALDVQRCIEARNEAVAEEERMRLRIGLHVGEVRIDGERLAGDGVNTAARIEALAPHGGIAVSAAIADQVRGKLDVAFDDLGPQRLRNIAEPVPVLHVAGLGLPASGPTRPTSRARVIAAGLAALVLAVVCGLWLASPLPVPLALPRAGWAVDDPPATHVVVLPFADLSEQGDQAYFGDGLAEEIIHELAQIGGLQVVARTSAFAFREQGADVREIGRELGVGSVLEGSVRTSGERMRVTAQLVRADDGLHIWSKTFDRERGDVFAVQDEIAGAVAEALEVSLVAARGAGPTAPITDAVAYDHWLQGRHALGSPGRVSARAARAHFDAALERAPRYAAARAGRARSFFVEWLHGDGDGTELLARAEADADAASLLDPGSATASEVLALVDLARGGFASGDAERTRPALMAQRASVLAREDTNAARAWSAALALGGDAAKAYEVAVKSLAADPYAAPLRLQAGVAALAAGAVDESLPHLEAALRLAPDSTAAAAALAEGLIAAGRDVDALRVLVRDAGAFGQARWRLRAALSGAGPAIRALLASDPRFAGDGCGVEPRATAGLARRAGEDALAERCAARAGARGALRRALGVPHAAV